MFSTVFAQFLVIVLAAVSAGTMAWLLLTPLFSSERQQKKRVTALASGSGNARGEHQQNLARRKQGQ